MSLVRKIALGAAIGGAVIIVAVLAMPRVAKLLATGDARELREGSQSRRADPNRPGLLVLAFDGLGREQAYALVRSGELPGLAALLGAGPGPTFEHAHFDETLLSVLPSTTVAAWAATFTGVPPAVNGVTGNEFFVREADHFAAPAPVTLTTPDPVLAVYADGYAHRFLDAPTVYERLRAREPAISQWVGMSQFYRGADRLLLPSRTALAEAAGAALDLETGEKQRPLFGELDEEMVETLQDELEDLGPPDVLTLYFPGLDLYTHHAEHDPDHARRTYLREELDPRLVRLGRFLQEREALRDRFVVVLGDHGHTDVEKDDAHALGTDAVADPPAVLAKAGFRVRPFEWKIEHGDHQAVLAYQGAFAYVSLADRSTCANPGTPCAWDRPPRFEEDVLAVAEAFHRASTGDLLPAMRGTLDAVFVRRPRPVAEEDGPFEVYVGNGRVMPVEEWLAANPHPTYVAMAERLRGLAVGRHGERAGDVLLLANNGNREDVARRYYFSPHYESWHGSPSRRDGEIPLIVAHPQRSAAELEALVREALGETGEQWEVTDLLLHLRAQPAGGRSR